MFYHYHINQLNYKDGVIVSGSLEALLEEFYPTAKHYPDVCHNNVTFNVCYYDHITITIQHSYIFAFILCIRLFIQPHELLAKVSRVCDHHD